MQLATIFAVINAAIYVVSDVQYVSYLIQNRIVLNKATWFVTTSITVLSASSYFYVVKSGNPIIAAANIITAAVFVFIFIYSLIRSRFASFTAMDKFSLATAVPVIIIWKMTGNARIASLILQLVIFISFVPTILGLLQGRLREKPIPWLLGVIASVFGVGAVLLTFGLSNPVALTGPLILGIMLNGIIAFLAFLQDKKIIPSPK